MGRGAAWARGDGRLCGASGPGAEAAPGRGAVVARLPAAPPDRASGRAGAARQAAKTEAPDPWHGAAVLSHPAGLPHPFALTERTRALRTLTRHRHHRVRPGVRAQNDAARYRFLKTTGVVLPDALDLPTRAAAALRPDYQTVEALATASLEARGTCLPPGARGPLAAPAPAVQRTARASFRLPGGRNEPGPQIVSGTFPDLRHLAAPLQQGETRIAREPAARAHRRLTIPGIGPVFAAGILAARGALHLGPDDDPPAQFAGLTWPPRHAGPFTATDIPRARTGPGYRRPSRVDAANRVPRHAATYPAFYARKDHDRTQHAPPRALVLTARKLTRWVFARRRDDQAYAPPHRSGRRGRPSAEPPGRPAGSAAQLPPLRPRPEVSRGFPVPRPERTTRA